MNYQQVCQIVVQRMREAVFGRDSEKNLTFLNPAAEKLAGLQTVAPQTKKCFEFFGNSDQSCQQNCPIDQFFGELPSQSFLSQNPTHRCGRFKQSPVTVVPLQEKGKNTAVLLLLESTESNGVSPVSEQESQQQEVNLRIAEKAESLERMAGAVAHHFNNLLAAIIGNLELAGSSFSKPDSEEGKFLSEAMSASQRAAELSGLMLAYLGQSIVRRQEFDLAATCTKALSVFRQFVSPGINLEINLPNTGPQIIGDPELVNKIVTNLLMNALEAIPQGNGSIRVALKLQAVESKTQKGILFPTNWKPTSAKYACLEVMDSGCGMEPGIVAKIFDPFFTTKFTGRGLGMPVVLGAIRSHNGGIRVESKPGQGSTIRAYFPVIKASVTSEVDSLKILPEATLLKNTILLIDDEDIFREMCLNLLKRLGFEVLQASRGEEGVELYEKHQDRICCVLTDLSMPGMDGWQTLKKIRSIKPGVPVILASGYDEAQVMGMSEKEKPQVFLHKPFQTIDLKVALAKALKKK